MERREYSILKREYDLLEFAVKRWAIPCCKDNNSIYLSEEFDKINCGPIVSSNQNCYPGIVQAQEEPGNSGNIEDIE